MPRDLTCHTTACMTRQQLEKLLSELARDEMVRSVSAVPDFTEGRLVCEWDAPDRRGYGRF